jgi:hypothetical protein
MDGFMAWFDAVMLRVFAFPRPVVAALGGHAVAGGAVLALACDARVMGAGAGWFGLNEVRLGVPFPASALEIVRYAVPARSVEAALYDGELVDPRAALARGLVTEVVEGDVVEAAHQTCGRLAAAPTAAFEAIKGLKGPAGRARATLAPLRAFVRRLVRPGCHGSVGRVRQAIDPSAEGRPALAEADRPRERTSGHRRGHGRSGSTSAGLFPAMDEPAAIDQPTGAAFSSLGKGDGWRVSHSGADQQFGMTRGLLKAPHGRVDADR